MNFFLEKEMQSVRVIDSARNYWFVRTYSGGLFEEFQENNYVGIGFNKVPYEYIKEAKLQDKASSERLRNYLENNYSYKGKEITKWANQLINFEHNVKVDDIVIIPSSGSDRLAIGVVKGKTYVREVNATFEFNGRREPYPEKRKKIEWLKVISKGETLGDLRSLFSTRQALTNANPFSEIIEGNISTIFIKNEKVHLVLKVDQDEDINAYAFRDFLDGLTYFYEEFSKDAGDTVDQELSIKIKVQSKGKVALIGASIAGLLGIAGLVALSDNSEIDVQLGTMGLKAKTTGLIKSWSNKKDADLERKMKYEAFQDSLKRLDVKTVDGSIDQDAEEINDN